MTYCSIICQTLVWYQDHVFINIGCQYWILNLDQDWVQYLPNMGMVLGPCLDQYWMPIRFPTLDQDWKSNIGQTWAQYQDLAWINIECQYQINGGIIGFPILVSSIGQDWSWYRPDYRPILETNIGSMLELSVSQYWDPILDKIGPGTAPIIGQYWYKILDQYWKPILDQCWNYRFPNIGIQYWTRLVLVPSRLSANVGYQYWPSIGVLESNIGPILDQYIVFMGILSQMCSYKPCASFNRLTVCGKISHPN